ncbi:MAG: ABC transporter permease [Propionibacteriaceae bacterium]|jgi:ABC-2 type transport system permease protein|nr:ABC transporter permease [Propionibacteriaceae bacterium]
MTKRVWAICVKEFLHLWRDPRMLGSVLLLPVFMLMLFAFAISFDIRNVPTGVFDLDNTAASREYAQAFAASDLFTVKHQGGNLADVERLIDEGSITIALVIPAGFADELAKGEAAGVGVYVDGSEPNSGRMARAAAIGLSAQYTQKLAVRWADAQGIDISTGGLDPRLRTWYNPELKSSDYLIPGLMVVIMMIVTVQQTAISLVRERNQGTQDQITVSPTTPTELIVGKLLPWSLLTLAEVGIATFLSWLVFHIPLRGDLLAFGIGAFVFAVCGLGFGLLISAFCNTTESASMFSVLVAFLQSFLLSGFVFALEQLPVVLQWFSYLLPARYMVTLTREVFLKGGGFAQVWPELVFMVVYVTITVVVAARLYRRRMR